MAGKFLPPSVFRPLPRSTPRAWTGVLNQERVMSTSISLAANDLIGAFQYAWLRALHIEAINASNVAYAAGDLLKAVILASERPYESEEALGAAAFKIWQSELVMAEREATHATLN